MVKTFIGLEVGDKIFRTEYVGMGDQIQIRECEVVKLCPKEDVIEIKPCDGKKMYGCGFIFLEDRFKTLATNYNETDNTVTMATDKGLLISTLKKVCKKRLNDLRWQVKKAREMADAISKMQ